MSKKRGRSTLSDSETLLRTYKIPERTYQVFKNWCDRRGFTVSEVVRMAISQLMKEGNLSMLLENEEMRNLALNVLSEEN